MASDIDHLLYELDQLSLGTRPRPWHVHGDRAVRADDGQPVAVCTSPEGAAYIVALANSLPALRGALPTRWTYYRAGDRTPLGTARHHVQRRHHDADREADLIIAFLRGFGWSLEKIAEATGEEMDAAADRLGLEKVLPLAR